MNRRWHFNRREGNWSRASGRRPRRCWIGCNGWMVGTTTPAMPPRRRNCGRSATAWPACPRCAGGCSRSGWRVFTSSAISSAVVRRLGPGRGRTAILLYRLRCPDPKVPHPRLAQPSGRVVLPDWRPVGGHRDRLRGGPPGDPVRLAAGIGPVRGGGSRWAPAGAWQATHPTVVGGPAALPLTTTVWRAFDRPAKGWTLPGGPSHVLRPGRRPQAAVSRGTQHVRRACEVALCVAPGQREQCRGRGGTGRVLPFDGEDGPAVPADGSSALEGDTLTDKKVYADYEPMKTPAVARRVAAVEVFYH